MPISALPPAPQPTDTQAQFNTKAFNLVAALSTFVTEANAVEAAVDADAAASAASAASAATQAANAANAAATAVAAGTAITASSATSLSITTGSKTLTIDTGRAFVAGMPVRIGQAGANANVNYMDGDVTSYNAATGDLVVDVNSTGGTGTFSSWSVRAANTRLPDQTGNAGKYLGTDGTNVIWSNVQGATFAEYTASGTWTKPAGATFVMVELWGAGGGGGSGRRGPASNERYGGGGGGGGAYGYRLFKASDLGATEPVTIGAGGAGAAAVTVDSTDGTTGTAGGTSSFGAWLSIFGGNGGNGGRHVSTNGGSGGGVLSSSGLPANNDTGRDGHFGRGGSSGTASGFGGGYGGASPNGSGGSSYQGGPAGGGGGQISGTNVYSSPGSGGGIVNQSGSGAQRGVFPGTAGASGTGRQGGAGGTVGSVTVDSCVDVTFGNGTFAGVSSGGFIWTSSNGTNNWVAQTGPSNLPVQRLMHDGTQFVLFDTSSRVWTTTDFITYTARANGPWAGGIEKVRYQNSRYFVVRSISNGVYTSTDLVTWTQVTSGNGGSTYDICWTGTNYVVVSASTPTVRYSSDLVTWSTATGAGVPNNSYTCTSNGSGTVVINADSSIAQQVSRSTDHGQTFTAASTTVTGAQTSLNTASYHGGTYFLVWSSNLWTSSDGSSWTQRSTSSGLFGTVGYDGTTLAVGESTPSTNIVAYTSTLGGLGTWTSRTLTAINGAAGAGGAGGQPGGGGGGGGPSTNGHDSGAGGAGGAGLARIYTW